jgi:hypothetical protein
MSLVSDPMCFGHNCRSWSRFFPRLVSGSALSNRPRQHESNCHGAAKVLLEVARNCTLGLGGNYRGPVEELVDECWQ